MTGLMSMSTFNWLLKWMRWKQDWADAYEHLSMTTRQQNMDWSDASENLSKVIDNKIRLVWCLLNIEIVSTTL